MIGINKAVCLGTMRHVLLLATVPVDLALSSA